MEETSASHLHQRPRSRQPISVPFLWEEKPGKPKKNWKPEPSPVLSVPIPVKLIASVPFQWEEKPGKPRPNFLQHPMEYSPKVLCLSSSSSSSFANPFLSSPSTTNTNFQKQSTPSVSEGETEEYEDSTDEDNGCDDDTLELDFETFSFHSDETFHSAPSLLANQPATNKMMPSAEENNEQAVQIPDLSVVSIINDRESTSTGNGITKDSVLEFLFPLFSPHSGFLDRVLCQEKCSSAALPSLLTENRNCGLVVGRKAPTLGELIMLSRRLSYGRKVVPIKKQKHSLDIIKKTAFARCLFGTSGNRMDKRLSRQQFRNR
ncbi:hypothetical protein H6P81_016442 [Aristolochia fimbriata]|uniref:Hydroxyproline-rich glycoprotein family protein n=1 Tax=Aristolochia fimbriata TaxID=158543 RepID=A0AAV7E8D3_ARIFI|nr:hypothetical protein H6P81_016442 [Aristolochia fimbriata]